MKKFLFLFCFLPSWCIGQQTSLTAQFIGYQMIPFEKGKQGGISGIEYNPRDQKWYLGSDKGIWDLYTFHISYDDRGLNPPIRLDSINLGPIRNIEAIRLDTSESTTKFVLVNEPDDLKELAQLYTWSPSDKDARVTMQVPESLHPFKDNKGFEGLALDKDGHYWLASEQSLERDGNYIRFTHINKKTQQIMEQYAFEYSSVDCKDNGVSEILLLDDRSFLVLDRCFDGCKAHVKLFKASITSTSINVKDRNSLADLLPSQTLLKQEVLDIDTILYPDNLEGMAWGPRFADGSRALIIISDDNLKKRSPQITQLILFKIVEK